MKTITLILFFITYASLLALPKYRTLVASLAAACILILGIVPIQEFMSVVDWNVLMMIGGTMIIVGLFIESKMPKRIADLILEKVPNVMWAIIALALFSGFISAFVDNVATVLMVAPVALDIAKKQKISPIPAVIAIAVASNLQGAATLVGDTTSLLLGTYANMNFVDFFFYKGKPGLFWVVQIGSLLATGVLIVLFRKYKQPIVDTDKTQVTDYFPSFLLIAMVVLLASFSFVPNTPKITNGLICVGLGLIGCLHLWFKTKDKAQVMHILKEVDLQTIALLGALFVVVGSLTYVGIIDDLAKFFVQVSGNNVFLLYTIIVFGSVICSAFIDNIPYVATMLPVATGVAAILNIQPQLLYFGLIIGATLGGNMTPVGASANITALGILKKNGYEPTTKEFMKIGVPFTLVAVLSGYVIIWLQWGL